MCSTKHCQSNTLKKVFHGQTSLRNTAFSTLFIVHSTHKHSKYFEMLPCKQFHLLSHSFPNRVGCQTIIVHVYHTHTHTHTLNTCGTYLRIHIKFNPFILHFKEFIGEEIMCLRSHG